MKSPFMHDWLFYHAARTPEAPAVATPSVRLSYGVLADRVRVLAAHLATAGIRQQDRVVVALPNTAATVVASLAINMVGGTAVEVNPEWGPEVIAEILAKTGARRAFAWGRDARMWGAAVRERSLEHLWVVDPSSVPPQFHDALPGLPVTLLLEDGRIDPDLAPAREAGTAALGPDWPALVLYTSGSTGRPHGVIQTFRNIDANTRSIVHYLGLTADDRTLIAQPLSYCYGRSVLQTHVFVGGSVFLDNRFAFPRVVLETVASEGCTGFVGVPLTFEIIRRQVDVSSIVFPRLRYLTQAGGAMSQDTIAWARAAFEPAQLFVMYGQTEATARLSYLPPERALDKAGSIGIPIPRVYLRVADEDGRELPAGQIGELLARGDNVTPGYLDEPEETAAILRDGWLWTGDLASRDEDGFFFIRGRKKEILKIGGHRVSPVEIEQVIALHPDVAEAAVIGVKHDLLGEVPVAFVVVRSTKTPSEGDLRGFCRDRMPAYMVPVTFVLTDALPRTKSGKLLRSELSARYAAK